MKYMLLIHHGTAPTPRAPDEWARLSAAEQKAVYDDYRAVSTAPGATPGQELDDPGTATTVRVQDGRALITDGPFVETKEQLAGYYVVDCADLDEAIAWAKKVPAVLWGAAVEVRPVVGGTDVAENSDAAGTAAS